MQEKLDALVRTQAMQLFRQQGLHFTMQQVAEPLHISKKTIYTVYPSKEALLLDMVDHAFAEIHHCKQKILAGSGTLQEKLRAVIIAMPKEYAALDLRQMKELDEKYPATRLSARDCATLKRAANTTTSILPPKRGANRTGSWASTARRHSPSPPDTALTPSGGCRHPRWRWCAHAIGRTAALPPKPSGSSISQRTAATKEL